MGFLSRVDQNNVRKLHPLKGLGFPFKNSSGGFARKNTNLPLLSEQLRQLVGTEKGERVMNPDFGVALRQHLFEPLTPDLIKEIEESVTAAIKTYGNQVNLIKVEVFEDDRRGRKDLNAISIRVIAQWIFDSTKIY